MIITVCRKEQFNAAHRLFVPAWSDQKNKDYFGLCANPNYHGHNYSLIVKVSGEVDTVSGYLIDLKVLKQHIQKEVLDVFDHKNLNLDVAEFADLNPTAENIAGVIWHKLRTVLPANLELSVQLFETDKNFVEYHGR